MTVELSKIRVNTALTHELPIPKLRKKKPSRIEDIAVITLENPPSTSKKLSSSKVTASHSAKNLNIVSSPYDTALENDDIINIHRLFEFLADHNTLMLGIQRIHVKSLGNKLDALHPLAVWKYVLTSPNLKPRIQRIQDKSLVWNSLISEYAEKLKTQYINGNLTQDTVADFLKAINRSNIEFQVDDSSDWTAFFNVIA